MAGDTNIDTSQRNSPWRLRFSLKWLFLVVAILCVWLGFYTARSRRASELVALNNAIVTAIEANIRALPTNASFDPLWTHQNGIAALLKQTHQSRGTEQATIFVGGGGIYETNVVSVDLNVSRALATQSRDEVVDHLLSHYEGGLADAGLKRTVYNGDGRLLTQGLQFGRFLSKGVSVIVDVLLIPT